ncbi:hypothetical protein, partial [Bacillus cereus]|uniref:hypothetical protein n=1 Tax=Bacillus cereus TaxID=1396 RepID=UPI0020BF7510
IKDHFRKSVAETEDDQSGKYDAFESGKNTCADDEYPENDYQKTKQDSESGSLPRDDPAGA